eukprot:TRINITY_DN11886_c0_g2_i2.p1 TRINITY_DN11886_c0_g2~~TRINITY_DN11886_c0_g2_i2.p1  ORF type:complete len:147 (+),score=17.30 TRINITY_DN11886_c0_g2_i2:206-646(+)
MTAAYINSMGKSAPVPSDRRYSDLTPDEVKMLRSQSLATLNTDGAALVKKFALPPADTMKIHIPTSSATPHTAVTPLIPPHRTDLATSQEVQEDAANGAHPSEVLDTQQRQVLPSQHQQQQHDSERHPNQMPVAELDDDHTDVVGY